MRVSPRAKLNLTLSVGARGADGYHPLESVFLRVGLADSLVVALAPGASADALTIEGPAECPTEGNLVLRAFALARDALSHDMPPLAAHLDKRIPLGGGLGGGSSDAAAAIEAALIVWGAGLAPNVRAELELALGADVPFFARDVDVALVDGRGERVEELAPVSGDLGVLLVTPPFEMATARVFARFDDLGSPTASAPVTRDLATALRAGLSANELCRWAARLRDANDLWPAAASLEPRLTAVRDELEHLTGEASLLTGSGSTLFALYLSTAAASEAGKRLASAESEVLGGAIISAVDLIGPDPIWRYP